MDAYHCTHELNHIARLREGGREEGGREEGGREGGRGEGGGGWGGGEEEI